MQADCERTCGKMQELGEMVKVNDKLVEVTTLDIYLYSAHFRPSE